MYEDNKDLWGDMPSEHARVNYVRSTAGQVDSARLLLEFGFVPSVKEARAGGGSELHRAAAEGDLAEVSRLADEADTTAVVDAVKSDGATALLVAAVAGHASVVKLLLEQGAEVDRVGLQGATALHLAAAMGHLDVMEVLMEAGADLNARHKFASSTPLHFAAEMGQSKAVRLLCSRGANVEAAKSHGGRALHIAADTDQAEVARVLLRECKADPNALLLGDTTPVRGFGGRGVVVVDGGLGRAMTALGLVTSALPPTPFARSSCTSHRKRGTRRWSRCCWRKAMLTRTLPCPRAPQERPSSCQRQRRCVQVDTRSTRAKPAPAAGILSIQIKSRAFSRRSSTATHSSESYMTRRRYQNGPANSTRPPLVCQPDRHSHIASEERCWADGAESATSLPQFNCRPQPGRL